MLLAFFFGFGCYSVFFALWPVNRTAKGGFSLPSVDTTACLVARYAGILFCVTWTYDIYTILYYPTHAEERYALVNRMFGPYWLAYWIDGGRCVIATQLLWFKPLRHNRWFRLVIGLGICISLERMVVTTLSFHRDYIPSSWNISIFTTITQILFQIGVFLIFTGMVHVLRTWLSKRLF